MKRLLALLALPALLPAVDGVVVNRTTGKPQPGVSVNLIRITSAGMTPAGSAKTGPGGAFNIVSPAEPSPVLLQVVYQGVSYSLSVPPGASGSGLQMPIFDATSKPVAKVDQHMILLETDGQEMVVNETIIYKNASTQTWADPVNGTLRVFVPAGAELRARATAPGGMPVERKPKPAREKGVYYLEFPIKPGETRFDVSYKMPVKEPITFSSRILHAEGATRVVVPKTIQVESADLESLGQEPSTKANIWNVKARQYSMKLTGTGTLKSTQAAAAADAEEEGPRISQIDARIYDRLYPILGLGLAVLALGFYTLYRKT